MKEVAIALLVGALVVAFAIIGCLLGDQIQQRNAHHEYVRRTELKQAEIDARLATLERIGIRLDVIDHTGMWMVKGVSK